MVDGGRQHREVAVQGSGRLVDGTYSSTGDCLRHLQNGQQLALEPDFGALLANPAYFGTLTTFLGSILSWKPAFSSLPRQPLGNLTWKISLLDPACEPDENCSWEIFGNLALEP